MSQKRPLIPVPDVVASLPEISPQPAPAIVKAVAELRERLAALVPEREHDGGVPRAEVEIIKQSELHGLAVPKEYGGLGESVTTILWVLRKIGEIDSGLSRLFGYHLVYNLYIRYLGISEEQQAYYYGKVIGERAWIGNSLLEAGSNIHDIATRITKNGDHYVLNGNKIFSTGGIVSDLLFTGGPPPDQDNINDSWAWVLIPTKRAGVTFYEDWQPLGQKAAYSGSATFENVELQPNEILKVVEYKTQSAFLATLILLFQLQQTNAIVGVGRGALIAARAYTRARTRPWPLSLTSEASQDPYILERYGEFFAELIAAEALADRANRYLEDALGKGENLSWEERGHASAVALTAKAVASKATLDIVQRLFETTGSRSAAHFGAGLDRYWRNARTETLHSPLVYHLSAAGNYVLNGEPPASTFYS